MLNANVLNAVQAALSEMGEEPVVVRHSSPVSGGDINAAYRLDTSLGAYFIKLNSAAKFPGMFEAEAKGLQLLAAANQLRIPKVIHIGAAGETAFLLLEFLETGPVVPSFWDSFGCALAKMHRKTAPSFGLNHDNYIGSLPQSNTQHTSWADFFIAERLEAQCKLARNSRAIGPDTVRQFERLYHQLDQLFPKELPCLIHGDLWSGNFLADHGGTAILIDPAAYYGHREMDIAMSKLFGGFSPDFYHAYNNEWPLADDWKSRVDVANLYPLLVHVNLFGGGYAAQVQGILTRFV